MFEEKGGTEWDAELYISSIFDSTLTSAVGNTGRENCSKPCTWICMVVRDLWKMVRDCSRETTAKHMS